MTISQLNSLPAAELKEALTKCCGAAKWVNSMMDMFPINNEEDLLKEAHLVWYDLTEKDWMEAFTHHPKIGDLTLLKEKFATTAEWAVNEQKAITVTTPQVLEAFAESNELYEEKFGYIFIVQATGKIAEEMLSMLTLRLLNSPKHEIYIAMEEQNKITQGRLKKLLL